MMEHGRLLLAILICVAATSAVAIRPANGADFSLEFLKEAEARGYGEVAIDYLVQLKNSGQLPSELRETYDLELSKALRIAVKESFNAKERDERQAKSKAHLEKFLKEHSRHPQVAAAQSSFGDMALDRGLVQLRVMRNAQDKDVKARASSEAQAAFKEAHDRFTDSTARYEKRFEELRTQLAAEKVPRSPATTKRKQAEARLEESLFDWLENRFKVGLADFYFAQTIEDLKDGARIAALKKASKLFDDIFQRHRESSVGLTAHAWQGKCEDELGNFEDAADIYEEVLSNVPDKPEQKSGSEGLFSQVFYFRALLEIKRGNIKEFLETAPGWLETYKAWKKSDGYQGISLEYIKLLLAELKKTPGDQNRKKLADANRILKDMSLIRSEYQDEAILLARSLKNQSGDAEAGSVDEAIAVADAAAKRGDLEAAEKALVQALEIAEKAKLDRDKKQKPTVEAALDLTRYRRALALFQAGKYDEVMAICDPIAQKKASAVSPQAASLAVSAALNAYTLASEDAKPKSLEKLTAEAQYTIATWPDKPEADDARINLGQAKIVQGDAAEAIRVFEAVNPRSERYSVGRYLAGQTYWRLHQFDKQADPSVTTERATKAEALLTEAVVQLRKLAAEAKQKNDPPPRFLDDAQLLLAEVCVEQGNSAKAIKLIAPQIATLRSDKTIAVDTTTLRTFVAAVRAYNAAGDVPKAFDAALALADMPSDQPQANRVLIGFASAFNDEWKKAEAAVIDARANADLTTQEAAEKQQKTIEDLLGQFIDKLSKREKVEAKAEIFMSQTAMHIHRPDLAEPLLKRLLAKADAGDASIPAGAVVNCRANLVSLMRQKGDYEPALAQIDKLIAAAPNTLEPLMEKGRILQAWAEKDESKFPDAVAHWTHLRQKLQGARAKPPEYYDVIYNSALCLFLESQKAKNPKQALDAAKLLNALLFTTPKLNGPDTVARYKELLKRCDPVGYKKREDEEKKRAKEEPRTANQ